VQVLVGSPDVLTYLRSLGVAVREVQHGRVEVGDVENATYLVTKSISR
jgi:hypothetical protein